MSRVQALIFTVTDLRADQGCGAQPHWTLGCRGHPPGGGARRDRGSSWTGGQPKGYWKTVALMGSALLLEAELSRLALFSSQSSRWPSGSSATSSGHSLARLSSSTWILSSCRSRSDMWENLQLEPKSHWPVSRNFLQGRLFCSSSKMAAASRNMSYQSFLALRCCSPFRCFLRLWRLSWKERSQ